mgnify:CR=1 FL=1|jgi:hypothetical protein
MKDNKVQIDTGRDILTVESYTTRGTTIVTAYVNGISIRCGSLHLDRVAASFVDTVITACQVDNDKSANCIEDELEAFITSATQ